MIKNVVQRHDTMKKLSKCLNLNDKALENTLRQIIFSDNNRIDWQEVKQIMLENMPEQQLEWSDSQ